MAISKYGLSVVQFYNCIFHEVQIAVASVYKHLQLLWAFYVKSAYKCPFVLLLQ